MNKIFEQMHEVIRSAGDQFSQLDLDRIRELSMDLPLDQNQGMGWIYEAIEMVVSSPDYKGDLDPDEWNAD